MPAKLSAGGDWLLRGAGLNNGAVLSAGPRHRPRNMQSPISPTFPRRGATLDLDFSNQRFYARGRGQSGDLATVGVDFTRSSSATRINAAGITETMATHAPRFDFDPAALTCKGLLIEEQRTNLLTYSEQFDNAAWTKSNVTIAANAVMAPDGTTTADKLVEGTTTSKYIYQAIPGLTSATVVISVFVKAAERTSVQVAVAGTGWTTPGLVTVDLTTGAVLGGSGYVQLVGNGWYRISVTGVADATVNNRGLLIAPAVGSSTSYTGDGTSGLYIWGAQLEAGAFPTSYIPTTSAQVTRSADVASMTGTNFSSWYRQDEGTFVYTAKIDYDPANSTYPFIFRAGTDNLNRILSFVYGNTNTICLGIDSGAVSQCSIAAASAITIGVPFSAAVTYKSNDCLIVSAGVVGQSDTSVTLPILSALEIGGGGGSSATPINGHISRITYFPNRLPNSLLQELSR